MWESRWMQVISLSDSGKNMFGVDFPQMLCLKTPVLRMFGLYTFKT